MMLLEKLIDGLLENPQAPLRKRRVELVLGTDREIGRTSRSQERRVGITAAQIDKLVSELGRTGIELTPLVLEGAGQRAGCSDHDYIHAGAEIVRMEELPHHDCAPDVVHAFKEPSTYEHTIPGGFCRIGALHTGDFSEASGLALLLARAEDSVFDGSNIGCPGAWRVPIRASMSVFAGRVGAEWVIEHVERLDVRGRAVVVGAGNAGRAATETLLACPHIESVTLCEQLADSARLEAVRQEHAHEPRITVVGIDGLDHPELLGALDASCVGVVFAVALPHREAPRIVSLAALRERTHEACMVVDISIDEGGAIEAPGLQRGWSSKELIPHLTEAMHGHGRRAYRSLSNMPRAYPRAASQTHGEVILPYIGALLALAAYEGGGRAAADRVAALPLRNDNPDPTSVAVGQTFDALLADLRNGLAFHASTAGIRVGQMVADREKVCAFLAARDVPFS